MHFLNHYAFVAPTADMVMLGWVVDDDLKIVVGFNGFMGSVCQMHVAMRPDFRFSPKEMLRECFKYAYNVRNCKMVLGLVNSLNEAAMKYDQHLGFKELWRLPKMHDDSGDIVVLGLPKEECRYLTMFEEKAA
jgi:RimJ/RimL family protein N-acetyltransferase